MAHQTCFRGYGVNGQCGAEFYEDVAYHMGRAYTQFLDIKCIAIGGDIRLSTEGLKETLSNGSMHAICDIILFKAIIPW